MLRLMKYELRKTLAIKIILAAVALIAEAAFLAGYFTRNETLYTLTALLLFMTASSGITLIGIWSIVTLHRDMNTRQSYMLFMTPNSCYRILGAKLLECGLSILLAGAFFFLLGFLDVSLIMKLFNESIWEMLGDMLRAVNERLTINPANVLAVLFWLLSSWLCTVVMACLADVLATSLLYGKKWNWLVSFALFIALNIGVSWITLRVPATMSVVAQFAIQGVIDMAIAAGMYYICARLMEEYLSV